MFVVFVLLVSVGANAQQATTPTSPATPPIAAQASLSQPTALMVGSKAPDFNGVDYLGKKHSLKALLKKNNAIVLFFYRGQWCPYCNKYIKEIQDNLAKITSKGVIVIGVTPETELAINTTISKTGASFPIINDKGYKIMKAYRVDYVVSASDLDLMHKYHIDMDANNGNMDHVLPIPATYVINKKEKIIFAHFDTDYRKRANINDLMSALTFNTGN